jgi:ribosomal protein S18 acetylase RimI-like enzyme
MTDVRLVVEPHAPDSLRQHVRDRLDLHNVGATGQSEYYAVTILLRDRNDEVLGGLLGSIWGGWLHVQFLWIAGPLRGRGHGRRLMEAAEGLATERGCAQAHLETSSFQAPAFYAKLGYEVFGTLEDFPPGHTKYFMRKRLVREA